MGVEKLIDALDALVDPESRGDPESPLRWTCKSTRQLAGALSAAGHPASHTLVGELLREVLGYRLQANAKVKEGEQHPDRDSQFRYINKQARQHLRTGQIVLSIDAKKKELLGEYKAVGRVSRRVELHNHPGVTPSTTTALTISITIN